MSVWYKNKSTIMHALIKDKSVYTPLFKVWERQPFKVLPNKGLHLLHLFKLFVTLHV